MTALSGPACVCGHRAAWHAGGDACDACGCTRFLAAHLPGQVMLGEGDDA